LELYFGSLGDCCSCCAVGLTPENVNNVHKPILLSKFKVSPRIHVISV